MSSINKFGLFSSGATVIVAVSGGVDSVALLDILVNLEELKLRIVIAHLNHLLRGTESDGDAMFVRELANSYGLPVEVKAVDVKELSCRDKLSIEEAGRISRQDFLVDVAKQYGADCIALAHHADDQAETVLMRLLRGSGSSGLCAMAPKSTDGVFVRPLLHLKRKEIVDYVASRGLTFRTDSSNTDLNFLRNRVRHELIPYLVRYNPAITDRLTDTATILAVDDGLLNDIANNAFKRIAHSEAGAVTCTVPGLREEPRAVRMRIYRRAIALSKGDLQLICFRHLQEIDNILFTSGSPNRKLSLPRGVVVTRSYNNLSFAVAVIDTMSEQFELFLEGPGTYPLPGGVLVVERTELPRDWLNVHGTIAYFNPTQTPFPWLVRCFRNGDRITPLGMAGRKKVKDLFIDEKIPLDERKKIPLVFSSGRLIWVGGLRIAHDARVTSGARYAIRAEIHAR